MSADPAMADGLNWYRYANNNPIMYSDPSGMSSVGNASVDPGFSVEFKPFEIRIKIGKSGGSSSGGDSATAPADNGDNNSTADSNEGAGDSNTGGNQSGDESSQNQDDGNTSNNNQRLTPAGDYTYFGKGGDESQILRQDNAQINNAMKNSKYSNFRWYPDDIEKRTFAAQIFWSGCLYMLILAMAQIETGEVLSPEQIVEIFDKAVDAGLVRTDGTVNDRVGLLIFVLSQMGYEAEVTEDLVGDQQNSYIITGISGVHFELKDGNGEMLYRPSGLNAPDSGEFGYRGEPGKTRQGYTITITGRKQRELQS